MRARRGACRNALSVNFFRSQTPTSGSHFASHFGSGFGAIGYHSIAYKHGVTYWARIRTRSIVLVLVNVRFAGMSARRQATMRHIPSAAPRPTRRATAATRSGSRPVTFTGTYTRVCTGAYTAVRGTGTGYTTAVFHGFTRRTVQRPRSRGRRPGRWAVALRVARCVVTSYLFLKRTTGASPRVWGGVGVRAGRGTRDAAPAREMREHAQQPRNRRSDASIPVHYKL